MKIGLYIRLFGRPGRQPPPPGWHSMRDEGRVAEAAGFDLVVLEDALLYPDDEGNLGVWDTVSTAAALAASTSRIGIGHAVINSPYRHPGLVARIAATLDEISDGRYTLGIGLGNTPDDYPVFGIAADRRYSRFAEAIQIIHGLVRGKRVDFAGEFYTVSGAELVLHGPRAGGPPIVIAGSKPKMLRLAARYADEWNWWTASPGDLGSLRPLIDEVDRACEEVGRDPATLRRSLDVFSINAAETGGSGSGRAPIDLHASDVIAEQLIAYGALGFGEVRCDLRAGPDVPRVAAIASLAGLVKAVHAA